MRVKKQPSKPGPTDLVFMQQPRNWPNWPFLPVKRFDKSGRLECGLLYSNGKPEVLNANLWDLAAVSTPIKEGSPLSTLNSDVEKLGAYETFDALVADGWVVD